MALHRYSLITSLPPLGELGSPPPLSPRELVDKTADFPGPAELVNTVLLADDLQLRQAYLAGEVQAVQPAVLTPAQVRNEQPLPAPLSEPGEAGLGGTAPRMPADAVWAAYYQHAWQVAARLASEFLARWVSFEVAMRNALAAERATALGLEPSDYLVVPQIGRLDTTNFAPTLAEWAAARNPLDGLRVLDRRRWAWIRENDAWFSFSDDEIAAYAAKLMLLVRWDRLKLAS